MRVLQVLPALQSGGVERGTVEFAAALVQRGHESFVLSSGGSQTRHLETHGSTHIEMPVHRKSLASFGQIKPVRQLLRTIQPDIVHVRSRMPAWITYLAWKGLPKAERPGLVSTFHGMYSVNPYSAVMAKAQRIIAVSDCVKHYVLTNYKVQPSQLSVIQRGVDVAAFKDGQLNEAWKQRLFRQYPQFQGKRLLLLPGRITRWKGQLLFLEAIADILRTRADCHGLIVGGAEPGKERFLKELEQRRSELGLGPHVTFLGQRSDMTELYLLADLVCHMSTKPEPFGRTVTEALASGTPVAAFNRGGAAETLQACFPAGLVPPDDTQAFARKALALIGASEHHIVLPEKFRLDAQTTATLAVYDDLLASLPHDRP
ncbi:glycosyltransferase family 4 protein [Marinobacter caseinilyticus]|uniref:glycosyltransferase family 4 protein n=1 Tax=Marinobacter caseinilyticus TaxID=2692195 RepID=UPI0014082A89|nr:glycosyltransferase family 4 protein [Marinobacter caseinilyticus]